MFKSKLICKITINARHDGVCVNIKKQEVIDNIRKSIESIFEEEESEASVSVLVEGFEYTDNSDHVNRRFKSLLDDLSEDDIAEIIQKYESRK